MLIPAYWYLSSNVGDTLTPWIVRKLGHEAFYVDVDRPSKKLLGVGSILSRANEHTVVWGAGIGSRDELVDPKAKLLAVRGPFSFHRAVACGYDGPSVPFGDPAFLMPKFYMPTPAGESIRVGVVPHYVDQAVVMPHYAKVDDVLVIDILRPPEEIVPQLLRCERVVSSSLHGLALSLAYGIPARWAQFSDRLFGDGVKFFDLFASIGIGQSPLDARGELPSVQALFDAVPLAEPKIRVEALLEADPLRDFLGS